LFACDLQRLQREIASGTDIIETYYQLEELRLRATLPKNYDWDKLRPQAEIELLGSHHNIENLHYACLSLDWNSLTSYGNCIIKLDESMIAHRASCFEGNTAVIFATLKNFNNCLRSCWEERGKIAVTAFTDYLTSGINEAEFSKILVATGTSSVDDKFIEVHIFGTMTARTFAEVTLPANVNTREDIYREAIIEKLNKVNVKHIY
jgi:hypothetical protein